MTTQLSSHREL